MKTEKRKYSRKKKGFFDKLYNLIRSLKLTIALLILLATLSIFGTVINQNTTGPESIERYGKALSAVWNFFQLFDMYHSWWFIAILTLMALNLIVCSLDRLPHVWRQVFHESRFVILKDSLLKSFPYTARIKTRYVRGTRRQALIQSACQKIFGKPRQIQTGPDTTLFFERGRFSRFGVYLVHLSILIILIGALIGSLYGFKGLIDILEGETVDHIYLTRRNETRLRPLDFSVRCDDFNISYYDLKGQEKYIKEYTSTLTLFEEGKEVLKQTVRVNHPLSYKGLSFYQWDYGSIHSITLGVRWRNGRKSKSFEVLEGENVLIPDSDNTIQVTKYFPQAHQGEGLVALLFKPDQKPQVVRLLKAFPKLDERRNDRFALMLEGVSSRDYTELQVTKDPGVRVVWTGFILMLLGLTVSFFFSHQKIWVRIPQDPGKEIILAGETSKNRMGFEKLFKKTANKIRLLKS